MFFKKRKPRKRKTKKKISFKYNLKIYWEFLKKYKLLFFTLLVVSLILEGMGVSEKFIFKMFVDKGTEFSNKIISFEVFVNLLIILAIVFLVITISRVVLRWLYIHMINHLDANLILNLKRKFFNHIIHLSHEFHTTHKSGTLISRLIRGARAIERMTDLLLFNFSSFIFRLIIVLGSLVYFDFLSAIVVLVTTFSFVFYNLLINSLQQTSRLMAIRKEDKEKGYISDTVTNIDSIKYFGKENLIEKRFGRLNILVKLANIKNWNFFRWLNSGEVLIIGIGTFFVVYFPIMKFLNGDIKLGTLVFIYTIYSELIGALFWFVHGIRDFYRTMSDFEDLFKYYKIENEIKDKPNAKKLKIKKGKIEFKNITFRYKKRKILDNFSLKIPANKKYALVGLSGSGKTTLIKLLYRFYDPDEGKILIDGRDIREFKKESLRSEFSIVPQECVLFDDTIYNNIKFSNPKASYKDVKKAMKFAQLDRIVGILPKGDKTIVGERGIKLSGGEKQRVSIARALIANKKVLVLDEATSSLDSETERDIQRDLQSLMKGKTCIIIAHRLSTIMNADRIIVIDKGKIVQEGTHKELIKKKGIYRKLWNLQKGGYL